MWFAGVLIGALIGSIRGGDGLVLGAIVGGIAGAILRAALAPKADTKREGALADIENKGTTPSIYRLYSLCAIYRLDMQEVLAWYGISLGTLPGDASLQEYERTHLIGFRHRSQPHGVLEPDDPALGHRSSVAVPKHRLTELPVRFHWDR